MPKNTIKKKIIEVKESLDPNNYDKEEYKELLRDSFKDSTCYIFGCGPSLAEVTDEELLKITDNNLVLSIKQAGLRIGKNTDFKFFNCCNFSKYPPNKETIFVGQTDLCSVEQARRSIWGDQHLDLRFNVSNASSLDISLSKKKNFEEHTIEKSWTQRPFGPGIMHETVLFFAVHLGISKIKTIGWDQQDPANKTSWDHFYQTEEIKNMRNPNQVPWVNEVESAIEMSGDFHNWLGSKGIELQALESPACFLHKSIKRYKL